MRDELNLMELADRYLRGELNATERAAFEERMRTNDELRELVEDQRALLGGMERLALRPVVNKAYRSYKFGKWLPGIGGAAVIAILVVGGWMLAKDSIHSTEASHDPSEQVEQLRTLSDTTGTGLPALVMVIDPTRDTTLLTPSGSLLDVPSRTFVDAAGNTVGTPVRVTMLEAFDASSIMKAGLSTMSGDTLLETGGMFFLDASSNGSPVAIAPGKTINVLIPADGVKAGMKLYDGVLGADSILDWKDPVELPRTLVPVDITTLDFYPPNYLKTIAELGSNANDRAYTDSLYWTFDCRELTTSAPTNAIPILEARSSERQGNIQNRGANVSDSMSAGRADNGAQASVKSKRRSGICGIDPAKVRTIWSERFNGTNLATREFEERMRAIHRNCDNAVLDLYVNDLDKDLRTLDRRAVDLGYGAFLPFAERNEGRVNLPAGSADRLKRIYAEWSRAHAEAARSAHKAYWERQRELDEKYAQRQRVDQESESAARQQLLREETEANMQSVYTQLGYSVQPEARSMGTDASSSSTDAIRRPVTLPAPPRAAFNAQVRTLGWKNIDQAMSAAYARQSTSVSDGVNTRRATITYDPCIVSLKDDNTYEEVRVYLIPQGFSSFQRMGKGLGTRYEENLNALFTYDLIILAQKTGSSWYFERRGLKGTSQLTAALEPISEEQLTRNLMGFDRIRGTALLNASNYMSFAAGDAPRQRSNLDKQELRRDLEPVVFPCVGSRTEGPRTSRTEASSEPFLDTSIGILTTFDEPPSFPGGDRAMRQFIYDNLRNPQVVEQEGITDRVTVEFAVEADGRLTQIRANQGSDPICRTEAERVIRIMPNWIPAKLDGRPIATKMVVPVVFLPRMNRLN